MTVSFNAVAWKSFRALIAQTQGRCDVACNSDHREEFEALNQLLDGLEQEFTPEIATTTPGAGTADAR